MNKIISSLISIAFAVTIVGSAVAESTTTGKGDRLEQEVLPNYVPAWRPDITRMLIPDLIPMFTDHDPVMAPEGHVDYCARHSWDCQPYDKAAATIELTEEMLDAIIDINRSVNSTVEWSDDKKIFGKPEHWAYPTDVGDCEDYALEKRLRLRALGVSASALLVTLVRFNPETSILVDHAVLTVRTNKGDLVLDMTGDVLPWQYFPFDFMFRQSPFHPARWEVINDIREEEMFATIEADEG